MQGDGLDTHNGQSSSDGVDTSAAAIVRHSVIHNQWLDASARLDGEDSRVQCAHSTCVVGPAHAMLAARLLRQEPGAAIVELSLILDRGMDSMGTSRSAARAPQHWCGQDDILQGAYVETLGA